jgi:hypothetical protein
MGFGVNGGGGTVRLKERNDCIYSGGDGTRGPGG